MTVKELIEQLSFQDENALVVIGVEAFKREIREVSMLSIRIKKGNDLYPVVQLGETIEFYKENK